MEDLTGVQLFLMGFGALLALLGIVLFVLAMVLKHNPSGTNKVTFLKVGFETTQPSLVVFLVGSGLIVAPLFVGAPVSGGSPGPPGPTPTNAPSSTPTPAVPDITPRVPDTPTPDLSTPTAPRVPTPTPTSPEIQGLTMDAIAGTYSLVSETIGGAPTGNVAEAIFYALGPYSGAFEMQSTNSGYYSGAFSLEGDYIFGQQQDAFGNASFLEGRVEVSGDKLDFFGSDAFGNPLHQVWQRS